MNRDIVIICSLASAVWGLLVATFLDSTDNAFKEWRWWVFTYVPIALGLGIYFIMK